MDTISTDKLITLDDVRELYTSGGGDLYSDYNKLRTDIINSDFVITLRQKGKLVALMRSNGDGTNNQYISEIILHAALPNQGFGSKLIDKYLECTHEVSKIYILSHVYYRTTFSKTWLQYKGFNIIAENENIIVYLYDRHLKY